MTKQICPIDALLTATTTEINATCDGATATAAEINAVCDGATATAAEINAVCDGATATAAEINLAADPSAYIGTYTVSAPAAIPTTVRVIELNHATEPVVKTIASLVPYAGQIVVIKDISATGTAAHTVTITTGTWNGTHKVATLDALNECLVVTVDSAGNGTVVLNAGTIILS